MQKIKNVFYEHRFGLFFFAFLMIYSFVNFNNVFQRIDTGVTYSIYIVDFSLGFCTRLLPGAIYNFFFDNCTPEQICVYINSIFVICLIFVAFLSEKMLQKFKSFGTETGLIIVGFSLVTSFICFNAGDFISILDFHWILTAIFFLIFIKVKQLYLGIPMLFIYCVMCHYGSMICYVPMFIIILILKTIYCTDKNEKRILFAVTVISTLISLALFMYMLMFEMENFAYPYEEFCEWLASKGVSEPDYYTFPFFREIAEVEKLTGDDSLKSIIEIDMNQNKLVILWQTVLNQIQVHLALWNHIDALFYILTFLPLIAFVVNFILKDLKNIRGNKFRTLFYLSTILLPIFTVVCGLFMSTDTLRWISHGLIAFTVIFCCFLSYDKEICRRFCMKLEGIKKEFLIGYFIVYLSYLFVV